MAKKQSRQPDWHEALFDQAYYEFAFQKRDPERTLSEVDFIEDVLGLKGGGHILDLCCGPGRHSLELARRGYDVTGLDRTSLYLKKAREQAKREKLKARFRKGDMRRIPFRKEFDAVINIFTSFGYFKKESDNQKVLEGAARTLKPGGLFLIDVINRDFLVKNRLRQGWDEANGWLQLSSTQIDWERSRSLSRWILIKGKRREEIDLSLRIYSPHEMIAMLKSAGLRMKQMFGGFDMSPVSPDANRLIVLARKSLDPRR